MFRYNGTGIKPTSGGFSIVPAGTYKLKIANTFEGKSKNGDPMVTVDFVVVGGEHDGAAIRFHNVTFFGRTPEGKPKAGAGMAVHFLKTIGEPWEGEYEVNSLRWRGRGLEADVIEDIYNGKTTNKVKEVRPLSKQETDELESVPF